MAISYALGIDGVRPDELRGFFEGWPSAPDPPTHLAILRGSDHVALARDATGRVVGFATALSDGVLAAYVPLLEVLPEHRGAGIGRRLVEMLLDDIGPLYMVDVVCDPEVAPFYESLGFQPGHAMMRRNRPAQAGLRRGGDQRR